MSFVITTSAQFLHHASGMDSSSQLPEASEMTYLLAASSRGDRAAFARLYDIVGARLYGIALRILRRRSLAEEVVQEAFLSIWRHVDDYDSEKGSPLAWMVTIVRNRALDRVRGDRNLLPIEDAPGVEHWPAADPSPLDHALDAAAARRLRHCLERLDDKQRHAIRTAYWGGFTHEELAARLATPLGTVKSWIRRGLIALKVCLET